MSSKYDSIKTAADLVSEVMFHGLSTNQDDLNRAADIIGSTSIEELARLANDIGRNNASGEPDPKGTWSSSRPAKQNTFYSIISHIWNWEEVTRFWNQHSNPEREELAELRKKLKDEMTEHSKTKAELKKKHDRIQELLNDSKEGGRYINKLSDEKMMAEDRAKAAEDEVVKLKAKLYDLMVAQEEGKR